MAPSYTQRRNIMEDTLSRVETILHEVPEGSLESAFVPKQPPSLLPIPETERATTTIRVVNSDTFTLAREIMNRTEAAKGRTAVLNLASDSHRAGAWVQILSTTQVLAPYESAVHPLLLLIFTGRRKRFATLPPYTTRSRRNIIRGRTWVLPP